MNDTVSDNKSYQLFGKPNIRFKDKETYFEHEYKAIDQRRFDLNGIESQNGGKPESLIGLAFSWGGI